jgi:hypothetical protein
MRLKINMALNVSGSAIEKFRNLIKGLKNIES